MDKPRASFLPAFRRPRISSLITKKKWLKVLEILNFTREMKDGLKYHIGTKGCEVSLLTFAILHGAPVKVVEAITYQVGFTSTDSDHFGMTPLHVACACGSSYDIVRALTIHDRNNSNTVTALDKCKRTPLHHLLQYICYPKEVNGGRAIFGNKLLESGASSISSSSFSSPSTTSKPSLLRRKKISSSESSASIPITNLCITQEHLEDLLMTVHHLVQIGPKAIFCRDIDRRCPIDLLQDCKAMCDPVNRGPQWERADIACLTLRKRMIKYYCSEKRIAERKGRKSSATIPSASVGTSSTMDNSSVMSGSILSGLSKLEVDSLSIGHMNLSVCSQHNNKY